MDINLLTVLRVSSSGFPTSLSDLLGSVFTYFTFWGDWRGRKSLSSALVCSLCGITSGETWHFLILSQAFQAHDGKFLSVWSCLLSWVGPCFCSPSFGSVGEDWWAEDEGSPAFMLVRVVPVYPTVIIFGGRTLTWLVSFPGKMIHVDAVKVNFPKTSFWEFSPLWWLCTSHLPTVDIQARLQDPLYKRNTVLSVLRDLCQWQRQCRRFQRKAFWGRAQGSSVAPSSPCVGWCSFNPCFVGMPISKSDFRIFPP